MYLCVCHAVKQEDTDRYHLIGTQCGRCLAYTQCNLYPGTDIPIVTDIKEKMVDTSTK
jgi:bacterioferritin-associated ferredoxin